MASHEDLNTTKQSNESRSGALMLPVLWHYDINYIWPTIHAVCVVGLEILQEIASSNHESNCSSKPSSPDQLARASDQCVVFLFFKSRSRTSNNPDLIDVFQAKRSLQLFAKNRFWHCVIFLIKEKVDLTAKSCQSETEDAAEVEVGGRSKQQDDVIVE